MYERYWLLRERPFETFSAEKFFCRLGTQHAVAEKLRYGMIDRPGCCLLTGLPGTGKTTLALQLIQQYRQNFQQVLWLDAPHFDLQDQLCKIYRTLFAQEKAEISLLTAGQMCEKITAYIQQLQQLVLLVIDNAHTFSDSRSLDLFKSLYESGLHSPMKWHPSPAGAERTAEPVLQSGAGVSLLFIGHPSVVPVLEQSTGFRELFAIQQMLPSLSPQELEQYLQHRLRMAGSQQQCFDSTAVDQIFQCTRGIIRKVNQLADLSLLVGFVQRATKLTEQHVQQAAQELLMLHAA